MASHRDLPPPLPPERRTIGQLVAEAIQLYRRRFWAALALGVPLALLDQAAAGFNLDAQTVFVWVFSPGLTVAYVAACVIAAGARPPARNLGVAFTAGLVVFLPAPLLLRIYVLPMVAWLAFAGLAVPAAVVERLGVRDSLRRGRELGRADYVHALGGLSTAVIVYFLSRSVLVLLLHSQADAAARISVLLADLVLSPLLYLVPALLYFDQAARVVGSTSRPRRRRDADVHHAHESDRPGRADAEVEPRPAARGES